ncbi:MAG: hypothetical protein V3V30_03970 [Parvularculaceae bacterium]
MAMKRSTRIKTSLSKQIGRSHRTEHQTRLEAIRLEQEELKLAIQRAALEKATSVPCQKCASQAEAIKQARQEWEAENAAETDKAQQELEGMIANIVTHRHNEDEDKDDRERERENENEGVRGGIFQGEAQPDG